MSKWILSLLAVLGLSLAPVTAPELGAASTRPTSEGAFDSGRVRSDATDLTA